MKKIIVSILAIIIFLFDIQISKSQLNEWNLISTRSEMYSMNFTTQNNGVVYAGRFYYKTTDGGNSWSLPLTREPAIGLSGYPNYMCFIDGLNGFAVRGDQHFLKTTDGGNTWNLILTGIFSDDFFAIDFINSNTGWVAGYSTQQDRGCVWKTTNGGNNWTILPSPSATPVNVFQMLNNQTGFCSSNSRDTIKKTTNGGFNWTAYSIGTGFNINEIIFFDTLKGFANVSGAIHRTTNGGINWTVLSGLSSNIQRVFFLNHNVGWVVSGTGIVSKTTNGGYNWINQSSGISGTDSDIYFKDEQTGWAFHKDGKLLKTTNGGINWGEQINSPLGTINSINFFDINNGCCVNNNYQGTFIWKTINRGYNWTMKKSASGYTLVDVQLINNRGYACGTNGYILYSSNGGNNWNENRQGNTNFNSVYFTNEQTGWVCGVNGTILKTSNGGVNWFAQTSHVTKKLNDIHFVNANEGFITCDSGFVLRTTNGGDNWLTTYPLADQNYSKINFINSQTGFTYNYKTYGGFPQAYTVHIIMKTTNAGLSWMNMGQLTLSFGSTYSDMRFINEQTGYMSAYELLKTTNGGANWFTVISSPSNHLNSIDFVNNEGWVSGHNGTVYTTASPVGISSTSDVVPDKFLLHQNYPNPFNPATRIKFDIPKSSIVELKVYDIMGREVATLINQYMNAGSFDYEWSASQFSSGIYFYRLTTEDFSVTKKMVLLK